MLFTQVGGRWLLQTRNYSAKEPLTLQLVKERVLLVLKLYDKVNPEKVIIEKITKFKE
jgi:NADH dehydrogenase (ubiquinone) 1 alpha/beta subcomplex 1, acyl-carrier protein